MNWFDRACFIAALPIFFVVWAIAKMIPDDND